MESRFIGKEWITSRQYLDMKLLEEKGTERKGLKKITKTCQENVAA